MQDVLRAAIYVMVAITLAFISGSVLLAPSVDDARDGQGTFYNRRFRYCLLGSIASFFIFLALFIFYARAYLI